AEREIVVLRGRAVAAGDGGRAADRVIQLVRVVDRGAREQAMLVVHLKIGAARRVVLRRVVWRVDVEERHPGVGVRGREEVVVLEAREKERLVLRNRAAAVEPGLFLVERRHLQGEEVRRVPELVV